MAPWLRSELFRELDAQVGAAHAGHGALESERDRLKTQAGALESELATRGAAIDKLQAAAAANAATLAQQAKDLEAAGETRTRLTAQIAEANAAIEHLTAELAARAQALAEAREQGAGDARRVAQLLEAAELRQAEHTTQMAQLRVEQVAQMAQLDAELAGQIAQLKSEAETRDSELAVLMAHLQEARRPIQSIEADVTRLTEELSAKSAALAQSEEDNRTLRSTVERTRGALEEREFLIRRLERSESNNANVLGRIQTSIERLGSVPVGPGVGSARGRRRRRSGPRS